jgi:hypothetical protein
MDDDGRVSEFSIHLFSMVDACTSWSKFARIPTAALITTAKAFDKNWLCRYPRPKQVIHDNGVKFMGVEFQDMLDSYGIKSKPTTIKNPTANAIVERIHGTLGDQLRTTIFDSNWSDDVDTLIQACAYALRVTSPATGPYSLAQLAFGYDLIFQQKVIVDWEHIKAIRSKQAIENNEKENRKRLDHKYKVGDKVLILYKAYERRNNPKISLSTYSRGLFRITEVLGNGTVKIQCGAYVDLISIRRLTPYYSRE